MNYLSVDYGTKRVGLAYSINGIISTLPVIPNDSQLFPKIRNLISENSISKVFVGISEGLFAKKTKLFVDKLSNMLELPVETVEEAVSTIEADEIFKSNQHQIKKYKKSIDSVAAAVILRRVIS